MKILKVGDLYFDTDENGESSEIEFSKVSPGVFFMHDDQTFLKSIGPFCLCMENYIIYKLNHDVKVNTINSIEFE